MFPGRYPTVPDNMWTFWNPQAMGLQGQFCGGDLMNQQSQAQSQAQTQAQLVALREQNNILNQQLGLVTFLALLEFSVGAVREISRIAL